MKNMPMDEKINKNDINEIDYGAVFNAVNDAIFVHDIETGAILNANQRACEMYCYSQDELSSINIADISADVGVYTFEGARRLIDKAANGEPQLFEWLAKDKAGRLFWVEVNLKRAVVGGKYRILAIVRDINHRKEDEVLLRLAEFSMERSADLVFWANNDADILYANNAAYKMMGYSQDELSAMKVHDIVPDFKEGMWEKHWEEAKRDKSLLIQLFMRRKNGSTFLAEASVNYFEFESSEYICAFVRDITVRKKNEENLANINETFLGFGTNPIDNINRLTSLCGRLLGADCALYNRIEGDMISACGQWNMPSDFQTTDRAEGHICYDVVKRGNQEVFVVRDLPATVYSKTDPNVIRYSLKTYIGKAVIFGGQYMGSICAVFRRDFAPTEEDKRIIGIVASAISIEESRMGSRAKLADEEKFLSDIFSSIQDGISVLDKDMRILWVNSTMEKWYSHSMPLVGKICYEAYYGRGERCKLCPTARAIETGKAAYEVVPKTNPHGDVIGWFDLYSFPLMDSHTGEFNGVIEYFRDISDKKAAEESLARRDYQLEILSRTTQHVNAVLEVKAILRTLVAAAMELVDANVGTAGLVSGGIIEFQEVNNLGKVEHSGYTIQAGHGAAGWSSGTLKPYLSNDENHTKEIARELNDIVGIYNMVNVPIVGADSSLLGCFEIANKRDRLPFDTQDIFMLQGLAASGAVALENARLLNQEKCSAVALLHERDQAKAYFDVAGVIMVAMDKDQKVTLINDKGCEVLGYVQEDIVGKNWFDTFVPEKQREDVKAVFKKLVKGETEFVEYYENPIITKSGVERIIAWHNTVLKGDDGIMAAILSSGDDITEKRLYEEGQNRMRDEVEKSNKRLKQLALKDYQTGLYNHHYLSDMIESEYYRAKRFAHPISVIMLDIDYFKSINDTYGHEFGDMVLKQFAKVLRSMIRKYDTVVRYGGEEFVVVSSVIDRPKAILLGQRILDAINLNNFGDSKHNIKLKLSIGIASYPIDGAISGMDLINMAEKILTKAKEAGGNRAYSSSELKKARKGSPAGLEFEDVALLKDRINKLTKRGNQNLVESIFAFAKTLELKDHYTGEHTENTVHYSTEIAKAMGLPLEDIESIRQASILHDLGKVGVSDKILHKKAKLTKREFEEIKRHPQIAADIIRPVQFLHDIIPLILYHHERWDGKGYPSGLIGPEIPLGARIISVADVYQALTSKRPYRKAFSEKEAIKMIKAGYGTQFDPEVVDVFMKVLAEEKRDKKKRG
ncbi:MAG: PAS domain S-box protein [Candidatus Omnitrophica bacterium]|nr:PAS domain S-box protein [Candidatus Omnitrophota bacterium]